MQTFVFQDHSGNVRVEYVTDLIQGNTGKFTVSEVKGLAANEKTHGFKFRKLVYDYATFVQFALLNGLRLTLLSTSGSTMIVDFDLSRSVSGNRDYTQPTTKDQTLD